MRSKITAAWIFCLFIGFGRLAAQDRVTDSLKIALSKAVNDSVRVGLLNKLCFRLVSIDPENSYKYGQQALRLSEKAKLRTGRCLAYNNLGVVYDQRGQSDSAMYYYNQCLQLSKEIKNIYLEASGLTNIGYIYWSQGTYDKALDYTLKGLAILDTGTNYISTANTIEHVAMIYYDLKDSKNSIRYHRDALGIYQKINDEADMANVYCNLALNYLESSNDSVIYYLKKAEAIFRKYDEHWGLGHVYNNIGGVYMEMKKNDQALEYLLKARHEHAIVNDERGMTSTLMSIGMAWRYKGNTGLAKAYIDSTIAMCIRMDMKEALAEAYREYAMIYAKLNLSDSVTKYLNKESEIKSEIFSTEKTRAIADMQTRYDTEKKDLEIAKQKAELEAKENEKKRRETFIFGLIGLIILIVLLSYFIYSRNKIKAKARLDAELANQRELRSKAVIEAEEKERRRIAQDLHDGVGQILSAAKLNLSGLESKLKLQDPEQNALLSNALDLVNDSVKEVRTVSHNMMPNTLIKSGLASAIREFISKMSSIPNLKIDFEIVGLDERLDNTVETILYRVIQEVVSNIIRHAKANHIGMQLIRHENELTVMIEDNGVGFDVNAIKDKEGLGLKGMITRVEYLNGQVNIDSTLGKGTTITIEVPC
jgi:signal transduction histidine kinase